MIRHSVYLGIGLIQKKTYSIQTKPFLLVDGDIFLTNDEIKHNNLYN